MRAELDMRYAVVERGRKSCGARFDGLNVRLWRAMERETVRNIATEVCRGSDYPVVCAFQLRRLLKWYFVSNSGCGYGGE